MGSPAVIPFVAPPGAEAVIKLLEGLLDRAKKGEFETILVVAIIPGGKWLTIERGKKKDALRTIGILESLKADVLQGTETDEPSGL